MRIDIVVGGLPEEKCGKRVRGTENKSKIQKEWEIIYRESSARAISKNIRNQSMASVRLTKVNQKENNTGHLPLLPSVHTATSAFFGVKIFHVSYGL